MKLISNDKFIKNNWVEALESLIAFKQPNYLELAKRLDDMITYFFAYSTLKGGTHQ